MKAKWNGALIAESDNTFVIEGNHYFPPDSVKHQYFLASDHISVCPWKGTAYYYSVVVDGITNKDATWYYPEPLAAAKEIKGYLAFWRGVDVCELQKNFV